MTIYEDTNPKRLLDLLERIEAGDMVLPDFQRDFVADMTSGTVSRTIVDDTLPGGPVERTMTYEAPFDRCDRVEDYRVAWEFFLMECNK